MGKKILSLAVAAVCLCGAVAIPAFVPDDGTPTAVAETPQGQEAIFLQSVTLTKPNGNDYVFTYHFDKEVSKTAASLDGKKSFFTVGGKALTEISGATLSYSDNKNEITATVPASSGAVKEGETTRVTVLGGFISETDRVTTVRYIYDFNNPGQGERIYRSDNMDDYEEVTVTSISVPSGESQNGCIYIYFSDVVTPKKYQDLQWTKTWLRSAYGEGTKLSLYSDSVLDLLYNYQVFDPYWENSLSHLLLFGCEDYNGLKAFPTNTGGIDMTPKMTVDGVELFSVRQFQESVAENGTKYIDKAGQTQSFNGQQCFAVQVHFDQNWIQFILKGDSSNDTQLSKVLDADGKEIPGVTSFHENLRPESFKQKMAIGVRKGLLMPNGKMVKQDFIFTYDYMKKQWSIAGEAKGETREDETLSNQEGYTDAELAQIEKNKA